MQLAKKFIAYSSLLIKRPLCIFASYCKGYFARQTAGLRAKCFFLISLSRPFSPGRDDWPYLLLAAALQRQSASSRVIESQRERRIRAGGQGYEAQSKVGFHPLFDAGAAQRNGPGRVRCRWRAKQITLINPYGSARPFSAGSKTDASGATITAVSFPEVVRAFDFLRVSLDAKNALCPSQRANFWLLLSVAGSRITCGIP